MDLGLWQLTIKQSKFSETIFEKSGEVVIINYNVLRNVTKDYNRFRTLVPNYKVV